MDNPTAIKSIGKPTKLDQEAKIALREQVKEQLAGLMEANISGKAGIQTAIIEILEGILPNTNPHTRARIGKVFAIALAGQTWGKALDEAELTYPMVACLRGRNPAYSALMAAVEDIAIESCKQRRIKHADARAFEGIERFTKDGRSYREYSDRLAELLITGDDRAKYAPTASGSASSQVQQQAAGPLAIQINVNLDGGKSQVIDVSNANP
jgi:hypothetical protein